MGVFSDLKGALNAASESAWQGPQTAIGLAQGLVRTGRLPGVRVEEGQAPEFIFSQEGAEPSAKGQTIIADPNANPEQMAHERVHTDQSRELGPLYLLADALGQARSRLVSGNPYLFNPMEEEAYLKTSSPKTLGQYQNDRLSQMAAHGDKGAKAQVLANAERKRKEAAERTRKLREGR